MEKNFNDNELDRAFRQGMDSMEVEPSELFWAKSESTILGKENISFRKKLFRWKTTTVSLTVLVVASVLYIFNLQNDSRLKPTASANFINPVINGEVERPKEYMGFSPEDETSKQPRKENKLDAHTIILPKNTLSTHPPHKDKQIVNQKNNSKNGVLNSSEPISIAKNDKADSSINGEEKIIVAENYTPVSSNESVSANASIPSASASETSSNENKNEETVKADSSSAATSSPINNLPGTPVKTPPALVLSNFLSRISVSGFFSPSIAKQFLKDNNDVDDIKEDDINESEEEPFAYSTGIKAGYDLQNNWSVQTGCNYSVSSFNINPTALYAKPGKSGNVSYSLVTGSGVVEIPSDASTNMGDTLLIGKTSTQTLSFISIPLQIAYNHPVKRFIFYASAGVSANILLNSQTNVHYEDDGSGDDNEDDTFDNIEGLKNSYYGFTFGLGAKYMLTKKIFLSAEPSFSGALTPINKNVPIQSHPYFWNLGIGIGYHF